ncbi:VCBS repeat-containing protein [Spirosoma sp. 209]|uniref:VCBS repeat-containing protein n=1 Tax=Spirosoma sp. 209 TaxID=1955701 RepID=UPI00098D4701|nr:VCBS repeat-containing protein [Spirosoma sp. 209]
MRLLLFIVFAAWLAGCQSRTARFDRMTASQTGIRFANTITETDSLNVLEFEYIYNGGGVGVGDFNGDGRPDVFFAGNQVSSQLYLNRGNFAFEDVTRPAGVETHSWCTGVSVADVNQDGRQDLYISTIHPNRDRSIPNLLFINTGNNADGIPQFREMAQAAGLADSSYSTQATWLDYDQDGDQDMFLLTNALEIYNRNTVSGPQNQGRARSRDKLFRNDTPAGGPLRFTDVSDQAGLVHEGWGLGVVVNDINLDGWPDIYVANDFQSNDVWLINNRQGGFENQIARLLKHQSHNSMGADMADINNDGLTDLAVVDMMPDDNLRQKTMFSSIPYDRFQLARRLGYQPQYVRNMLQLNRGGLAEPAAGEPAPSPLPHFSDIGYLAGTSATDWSWSALLADLDNDGLRDLLITNGYRKDITDLDFTSYNRDEGTFGSDNDRRAGLLKRIADLEPVDKPNFLFHNQGNLRFADVTTGWGLSERSFTNGTAYADFDDDGDLDLVMNNINGEAFLYRNQTTETASDSTTHHFLRISLVGRPGNREGLGAKVAVWAGGQCHYVEHTRQRGYQSSVESELHIGLGPAQRIDSLRIWWPGGSGQTLQNLPVNQTLTLNQQQARPQPASFMQLQTPAQPLLTDVTQALGLTYQHQEDDFVDYKQQQATLPRKHSQIGPGLAVGDVDGNGLDDLYLAGAANRGGTFFLQQASGPFVRRDRPAKLPEETGVLLFDADRDGDLDLYAVHGSTEFGQNKNLYQDSLYLNDGRGHFRASASALPPTTASGSCVLAADYDQDGDLDLFIGGRVVPQRYPEAARSYILRNDSAPSAGARSSPTVRFTDVTDQLAPGLARAGLVCAALWTDVDKDSWPDLLLAGEFMPITLYRNKQGRSLVNQAAQQPALQAATGFWNSLTPGDFDNDGDLDYIAGNLGLNSRMQAPPGHPISVYAADYDKNGSLDPIISLFNGDREYPLHPRDALIDQIPSFKKRMTSYAAYGKLTLPDLLTSDERAQSMTRQATYLASAYIENRNGTLLLQPLPTEAQFSPIFGTLATDLNRDNQLDLLTIGNDYATEVLSGYQDAGLGLCLLGGRQGSWKPLRPAQSGLLVDGDAKAMGAVLLASGQLLYVSTQNNGPLRAYRLVDRSIRYRRQAGTDKAAKPGQRLPESGWGGGYLSQSSRVVRERSN